MPYPFFLLLLFDCLRFDTLRDELPLTTRDDDLVLWPLMFDISTKRMELRSSTILMVMYLGGFWLHSLIFATIKPALAAFLVSVVLNATNRMEHGGKLNSLAMLTYASLAVTKRTFS